MSMLSDQKEVLMSKEVPVGKAIQLTMCNAENGNVIVEVVMIGLSDTTNETKLKVNKKSRQFADTTPSTPLISKKNSAMKASYSTPSRTTGSHRKPSKNLPWYNSSATKSSHLKSSKSSQHKSSRNKMSSSKSFSNSRLTIADDDNEYVDASLSQTTKSSRKKKSSSSRKLAISGNEDDEYIDSNLSQTMKNHQPAYASGRRRQHKLLSLQNDVTESTDEFLSQQVDDYLNIDLSDKDSSSESTLY